MEKGGREDGVHSREDINACSGRVEVSENVGTAQEIGRLYQQGSQCDVADKEGDIYIRILDLEATASRAIKGSLDTRVGGQLAELGTLSPIHDRVCWKGKRTVLHWGLHPLSKGREPWVIVPDVMSSTGYVSRPLLIK